MIIFLLLSIYSFVTKCDFQKDALMDFYKSTNGELWRNNDGWGTNDDYCSWYGISCHGKLVWKIDLASNGLSGHIPNSIGNLTALELLELAVNSIGGTIPDTLNNLVGMYYIGVNDNNFQGRFPDLPNLLKMQQIYLMRNAFSGPLPECLKNFRSMVYFEIGNNDFNGTLDYVMDYNDLSGVDVSRNAFSGTFPVSWCDLGNDCDAKGSGLSCPSGASPGCCNLC